MSTRADNFTQIQKIPDIFSDFMTDLTPHPITGDVTRVKNEVSVRQSIKNLILTNYGERLFQPSIGSNVNRSLFEPNDDVLAEDLRYHIEKTLADFEPRARVQLIDVTPLPLEDKIAINIVYSLINSTQLQSVDLILRRVR
jgi:phage baseplate assembly protein W